MQINNNFEINQQHKKESKKNLKTSLDNINSSSSDDNQKQDQEKNKCDSQKELLLSTERQIAEDILAQKRRKKRQSFFDTHSIRGGSSSSDIQQIYINNLSQSYRKNDNKDQEQDSIIQQQKLQMNRKISDNAMNIYQSQTSQFQSQEEIPSITVMPVDEGDENKIFNLKKSLSNKSSKSIQFIGDNEENLSDTEKVEDLNKLSLFNKSAHIKQLTKQSSGLEEIDEEDQYDQTSKRPSELSQSQAFGDPDRLLSSKKQIISKKLNEETVKSPKKYNFNSPLKKDQKNKIFSKESLLIPEIRGELGMDGIDPIQRLQQVYIAHQEAIFQANITRDDPIYGGNSSEDEDEQNSVFTQFTKNDNQAQKNNYQGYKIMTDKGHINNYYQHGKPMRKEYVWETDEVYMLRKNRKIVGEYHFETQRKNMFKRIQQFFKTKYNKEDKNLQEEDVYFQEQLQQSNDQIILQNQNEFREIENSNEKYKNNVNDDKQACQNNNQQDDDIEKKLMGQQHDSFHEKEQEQQEIKKQKKKPKKEFTKQITIHIKPPKEDKQEISQEKKMYEFLIEENGIDEQINQGYPLQKQNLIQQYDFMNLSNDYMENKQKTDFQQSQELFQNEYLQLHRNSISYNPQDTNNFEILSSQNIEQAFLQQQEKLKKDQILIKKKTLKQINFIPQIQNEKQQNLTIQKSWSFVRKNMIEFLEKISNFQFFVVSKDLETFIKNLKEKYDFYNNIQMISSKHNNNGEIDMQEIQLMQQKHRHFDFQAKVEHIGLLKLIDFQNNFEQGQLKGDRLLNQQLDDMDNSKNNQTETDSDSFSSNDEDEQQIMLGSNDPDIFQRHKFVFDDEKYESREDGLILANGKSLEMIIIQEKISMYEQSQQHVVPVLSSIDTEKINQLIHENYIIIDKHILDIIRQNKVEKKFKQVQKMISKIDQKSKDLLIYNSQKEYRHLTMGQYEDVYEFEYTIEYYDYKENQQDPYQIDNNQQQNQLMVNKLGQKSILNQYYNNFSNGSLKNSAQQQQQTLRQYQNQIQQLQSQQLQPYRHTLDQNTIDRLGFTDNQYQKQISGFNHLDSIYSQNGQKLTKQSSYSSQVEQQVENIQQQQQQLFQQFNQQLTQSGRTIGQIQDANQQMLKTSQKLKNSEKNNNFIEIPFYPQRSTISATTMKSEQINQSTQATSQYPIQGQFYQQQGNNYLQNQQSLQFGLFSNYSTIPQNQLQNSFQPSTPQQANLLVKQDGQYLNNSSQNQLQNNNNNLIPFNPHLVSQVPSPISLKSLQQLQQQQFQQKPHIQKNILKQQIQFQQQQQQQQKLQLQQQQQQQQQQLQLQQQQQQFQQNIQQNNNKLKGVQIKQQNSQPNISIQNQQLNQPSKKLSQQQQLLQQQQFQPQISNQLSIQQLSQQQSMSQEKSIKNSQQLQVQKQYTTLQQSKNSQNQNGQKMQNKGILHKIPQISQSQKLSNINNSNMNNPQIQVQIQSEQQPIQTQIPQSSQNQRRVSIIHSPLSHRHTSQNNQQKPSFKITKQQQLQSNTQYNNNQKINQIDKQKIKKQKQIQEQALDTPNKNLSMNRYSLLMRSHLKGVQKRKQMTPVQQAFQAIQENQYNEVEEVFIQHPNISLDERDEFGNTLLILAAQCGNIDIVHLLVSKIKNINTQNNDGDTALHMALVYNNDQVADYLIKNGAYQNIKNNNNQSPWDMTKQIE